MKQSILLSFSVLVACTAFFPSCGRGGAADKPSILLVTLDTTRADRLGCYGFEGAKTPVLDALAEEGIRFETALAQAAVTPVSIASIMTGLYPFQHGVRVIHGSDCFSLKKGVCPTLATMLKKQGYRTAAFVSAFTASSYYGLHHGFDLFDEGFLDDSEAAMQVGADGTADWAADENQRRADATADRAIAWFADDSAPFFVWIHLFDPHDPCLTPPHGFCEPFLEGTVTSEQATRALYDAEVAFMDLNLGRVISHLEKTGQYEDTMVVVSNDHGEGLGDHGWWYHRILYQEQLRMPLILRLPEGPGQMVVQELVRSIDIVPTILEFAGAETPSLPGKSLMSLIRGEQEPGRISYADALITLDSNKPAHIEDPYNDLMYSVTTDSWKLIYRSMNPERSELYRIDEDPREERNVISKFPEMRARLLKLIQKPGIMIDQLIPPASGSDAAKQLEDLGYL